jgi:hypothetical protein
MEENGTYSASSTFAKNIAVSNGSSVPFHSTNDFTLNSS